MNARLLWMAAGAGLSALAFSLVQLLPSEKSPEHKPYFIVHDTQLPYSAIDRTAEGSELQAKRSVRIVHECGANRITNLLPSLHSPAEIIVDAGYDQQRVTDCIESHAAKGEVEFRFVWLTDREKIF